MIESNKGDRSTGVTSISIGYAFARRSVDNRRIQLSAPLPLDVEQVENFVVDAQRIHRGGQSVDDHDQS
jgi:hypothetical protein